MRMFLIFLLSWSQAFAAFPPTTLSGQSDTSKPTTFNFVTPYNQATIVGASTALYENGSNNLLRNPSFEAITGSTSWDQASGSVAADETTNIFAGKKSQLVTLTAVNGLSFSQDVTPTIQMLGSNFEASVAIKTSLTTLKVCARQAAATFGTCATVQGDGNWHVYSVNMPGPSSGSVGVSIITSSSTSGTYYVDAGYVGLARNLGNGVPNNVFSAQISSAGVVSAENEDFINGNCTVATATFTCTFVANKFSTTPTCNLLTADSSNGFNPISSGASPSSLTYVTTNAAGVQAAHAVNLICTRSSTDWVQPTIQAPNWDTDWTSYTPTITGIGAASAVSFYWIRQSANLYIRGTFTTGTPSSSQVQIPLPSGLTTASTISANTVSGYGSSSISGSNSPRNWYPLLQPSVTYVNIGTDYYGSAILSGLSALNGNTTGSPTNASGVTLTITSGPIPILGWTKTLNAPMLVGSVTSNATGAQLFSSVNVGGIGTNGTCSTTPCTLTSNDGFTSVTRGSAGQYTATLSNTYSSNQKCSVTPLSITAGNGVPIIYISNAGVTGPSFIISCFRLGANVVDDCSFSIQCIGPR